MVDNGISIGDPLREVSRYRSNQKEIRTFEGPFPLTSVKSDFLNGINAMVPSISLVPLNETLP